MNIYLISADTSGYDVYSDAVVAAETEEAARITHPSKFIKETDWSGDAWAIMIWAPVNRVTVKLIGSAAPGIEPCVICSSFHAG